jgi:hypothetical protein
MFLVLIMIYLARAHWVTGTTCGAAHQQNAKVNGGGRYQPVDFDQRMHF